MGTAFETGDSAPHSSERVCHKCGREIEITANFCGHCGTSVLEPQDMPTSGDDPYVGEMIDNAFRVEEAVGVGSMGVVYRATQMSLKKPVALKILRQSLLRERNAYQRFRQEALAASKLRHPNTINVIHFGECFDGAPYIAMEYLDGRDLGQVVAEEFPLRTHRVVSLLVQTCNALEEAHAAGIVHRDLKPANIVVGERRGEEFVKVLDFGIAQFVDAQSDGMTRHGTIAGTPAFMSPEQIQDHELDARSDLFSLGGIMYVMLTGRLPFRGESAVDMAASIMHDEPKPPTRVRLDGRVAPELENVCLQLLSKDPRERFQTAAHVRTALQRAYRTHVDEGGDARLSGVAAVVDEEEGEDGPITASFSVQTVMHQPAFDAKELAERREARRSGSTDMPAAKSRLPLIAAISIGVLLLGGVVVYALTSTSDSPGPADDADNSAAVALESARVSSQIALMNGATSALVTGLQRPAQDADAFDFTDDAELADADSGETDAAKNPGAGEDDEPDGAAAKDDDQDEADEEKEELTPRQKRRLKRKRQRKRSKKLYRKAKGIWRSDTDRAIDLLEEAVDLSSGSYRTWELLGDAYLRSGNRGRAAKAYKKVLRLNGDHRRKPIFEKVIEAEGL